MNMLEEYNSAIEAIEEYSKFYFETNGISDIYKRGLNVFLNFEYVDSACLFIMNEDSFEFELSECAPENEKSKANKIFNCLADAGVIGSALANKNMYFDKNNSNANIEIKNRLVIPLIKSDGIAGIIILNLSTAAENLDQNFYVLANIHSGLFCFSIENRRLISKAKFEEELIDQKVAIRTLNLLKSKKILNDKISNLQNNLTVSIPHEFRTPINQIYGSSDYLLKYMNSCEQSDIIEMLTDIRSSSERLKKITENYLLYANLQLISSNLSNILAVQSMQTESAQSIISEVVRHIAIKESRLEDIEMKLEESPIQISNEYFEKMIREITDNALKNSEAGTKIIIKSFVDDPIYSFSITNIGRGMSSEQISQIDAYTQFERRSYEQQGLGLGLAIVVKLVQLHNGEFNIESDGESYVTAIIKIPLPKENHVNNTHIM